MVQAQTTIITGKLAYIKHQNTSSDIKDKTNAIKAMAIKQQQWV